MEHLPFWVIVGSYALHLVATVVWLGGLVMASLLALPAFQRQTLAANQWFTWQRQLTRWANASLVVLLVTGFVQMTNDRNYAGFLVIDGIWAQAMLAKHLAFAGMVLVAAYTQARLYPALERAQLLAQKKPEQAQGEQAALTRREARLLRLNLALATAVLFFTAVATAV